MKIVIGTILMCLVIFITGYKAGSIGNKDELNNLRIQNSFLHDYKKAYIEHVAQCDTLHQACFKVGD